jgi:hypothetical protein
LGEEAKSFTTTSSPIATHNDNCIVFDLNFKGDPIIIYWRDFTELIANNSTRILIIIPIVSLSKPGILKKIVLFLMFYKIKKTEKIRVPKN